ncbi:MAG: amidohydrolase [Syntrophorhabdales bacterium]|jgi:hypothetical protein
MKARILDHSPETIFHNGKILCVDKDFSIVEAVAIKDGKFVGVGDSTDITALAGRKTRSIDLTGRTVLPGLIDTHNHMTEVALGTQQLSLEGSTCIADITKLIGAKARDIGPEKWVITGLIGEPAISHQLSERRYPTRWDLDVVSPDNPVCIISFHVFVVNSYALKIVGINKDTPQPRGGTVGTDPATGDLTGIFYEEPAMGLIRPFLPVPTHEDKVNGLRKVCRQYNAVGLTSICEHGIGLEELRSYQELRRRRELSVRSNVHLMVDPNQTLDDLKRMVKDVAFIASPGFGDEYLRIGGLKVIFDGGVGIGTALMREHYMTASGKLSDGIQVISTPMFEELTRLCSSYDLRLAQHDSGGKAIDTVLEVYEKISFEKPINDKRFIMVHCQFPTRENFEKIRKLGVVVTTQTMFLYTMGSGYIRYLGKELADEAIPLRDWLDKGLPVALSSDAPVNSFNPVVGIWHAVTRKEKITGEVIGPRQRITREEAIRCYTKNAAYVTFEEGLKGSIEPGNLADLVVLSNDILTCPEEEIKEARVEMTMVGGEVVYQI